MPTIKTGRWSRVLQELPCAVSGVAPTGFGWDGLTFMEISTAPLSCCQSITLMIGYDRINGNRRSGLGVVWKVSLLTTMVGLWTRLSAMVAFLVGGYLLGLPNNFGKDHHGDTIIPLMLLIFSASRCGDAWSMDRLMQRVHRPHERPQPSGEYTWPIRLVWLLTSLVFLASGIAKLRHAGVAWAMTDNMANILLAHYYTGHEPHGWIGLLLASSPWCYKPMAAAAMIVETLAPLALCNRMARRVIVPGLFMMLLTFPYLFGFAFVNFYSLFIFWIPWDRLGQRTVDGLSRLVKK